MDAHGPPFVGSTTTHSAPGSVRLRRNPKPAHFVLQPKRCGRARSPEDSTCKKAKIFHIHSNGNSEPAIYPVLLKPPKGTHFRKCKGPCGEKNGTAPARTVAHIRTLCPGEGLPLIQTTHTGQSVVPKHSNVL